VVTPLPAKILLVAAGFLLGSVPFGLLLTRRLTGVDVRQVGSGNIGATNVARAAGKRAAAMTLLLDVLKAVLPMLGARAALGGGADAEAWVIAVGFAAFFGHLFPPWLGFRGGKGVATGLGVILVLSPWAALAGVAAYALAFRLSRISSVGSLSGASVSTAMLFLLQGSRSAAPWAALAVTLAIVARHRENIARLVAHRESRL
jgi:acyl phosphate:glycerol-3-phosphate acyltransferase